MWRYFSFIVFPVFLVFYGWIRFGPAEEWAHLIGINVFHMMAGLIAAYWMIRARIEQRNPHLRFLSFLFAGLLLHILGNGLWLFLQLTDGRVDTPIASTILWCSSYFSYVLALITKMRSIGLNFTNKNYIFNLVVFMTTAFVMSEYYLLQPYFEILNPSLERTISTFGFLIADVLLLFFSAILYYHVRYNQGKPHHRFLVVGFLFQVCGDVMLTVFTFNNSPFLEHLVDVFWVIALLSIGWSGHLEGRQHPQQERLFRSQRTVTERDFILPYVSIGLLTGFVLSTYDWYLNILSSGWLLLFFLVLGRQIFTLRSNNRLLNEVSFIAYHDSLTQLANRQHFIERLTNDLPRSFAAVSLDLHRLTIVNDTMGHATGDRVLVETANRLRLLRHDDLEIYRIGGDEFALILPYATNDSLTALEQALLHQFERPFRIRGYSIQVTIHAGSCLIEDTSLHQDILPCLDTALLQAKQQGPMHCVRYDERLHQWFNRKIQLEMDMPAAIENDQFQLVYQPKVDLMTNRPIGMEALVRWHHPVFGLISPVEFISIAEESGHIIALGRWILKTACRRTFDWHEQGYPLIVAVNISVPQFKDQHFLNMIEETLSETNLSPAYLELEITESVLQDVTDSSKMLHSLRDQGIHCAIDDFGTGFSSLSILHQLPVHALKIDKSFVDDCPETTGGAALLPHIIAMGQTIGLTMIAEGVENEAQHLYLKSVGCHIGQGYYYARPLSEEAFSLYLKEQLPSTESNLPSAQ